MPFNLLRVLSSAERTGGEGRLHSPLQHDLQQDTIYSKIRETVELGRTGVLMQGCLHPEVKIDCHEKMLGGNYQ